MTELMPYVALGLVGGGKRDRTADRIAGILCVAMFFGGFFGGYLATHIPAAMVKKIFGGALFLISMRMIFWK